MARSMLSTFLVGASSAALIATAIHAVPATATPPATPTHAEIVTERLPVSDTDKRPDAAEDGKDLFRGVFFLQGDVGDALVDAGIVEIPGERQQVQTQDAIDLVDNIIDAVDQDDPAFFAEFSAELRSGDPHQVEHGLVRGAEQIEAHAEMLDDGAGAGTCAAVALAVVAWVWAGYAIHTAVVLEVKVAAQHVEILGGGLTAEEFVAALTPVLATS